MVSEDQLVDGDNHDENFHLCYQCGTCSGGCPVSRLVPQYNVRRIIKNRKENNTKTNDRFLWYCLTCYICYERCPQDIKPIQVLHSITNSLSRKGLAPLPLKEGNRKILDVGRSSEIGKFTVLKRKKLGLPKLMEDVSRDFKEIAKATGFVEMIE